VGGFVSLVELVAGALIGASVGAFAATAAIRLADGRNPWRGRSVCDDCERQLRVWETVPLVGYLSHAGKCRTCEARIDPLHPVCEVIGAVLLPLCLWLRPGVEGVLLGALAMLLMTTATVDLRTWRLLDVFTIPIAALAGAIAWRSQTPIAGMIAASISCMLLCLLKFWLERHYQKPMLGWGDVKLIIALALCLGEGTPSMLAIAAMIGLGVTGLRRNRDGPLPFGPMIAAAAIGMLLISYRRS